MGQIKATGFFIKGLYVIEPNVIGDERGYFYEAYNKRDLYEIGLEADFVQENVSKSTKGVLRGLHFQKEHPQGKLARLLEGAVFDVAVDLRTGSETFGKWYGVELSAENRKHFYIPEGYSRMVFWRSRRAPYFVTNAQISIIPETKVELPGMIPRVG